MVVYLVCFDLGGTIEDQITQVNYWLNFLYSSLSLPSSPASKDGKWKIFLVGLKSDLQKENLSFLQKTLQSWKKKWPRLPIWDQMFLVSSLNDIESVRSLFNVIGRECDRIFQKYSTVIPTIYRQVLTTIQSRPDDKCFAKEDDLFQQYKFNMDPTTFHRFLEYLHAIGRIVLFKNGVVCTNASLAPKIAANFVSPEAVRIQLLKKHTDNVQILGKEEIGCLLDIDTTSSER